MPEQSAILLSMPHTGIRVPESIRQQLSPHIDPLIDTDWNIHRLYEFSEELGITRVKAEFSRTVIDLNRPPDNQSLYKTATTGLIPLTDFDGNPLYPKHKLPDEQEIRDRLDHYWKPYHQQLVHHLNILKSRSRKVLLFDAHSIRPVVPRLFKGTLPDLNFGTDNGRTLPKNMIDRIQKLLEQQNDFSWVFNGRFRGGYITRHYPQPESQIFGLQLEISQSCYLNLDTPESWQADKAKTLQAFLKKLFKLIDTWLLQAV
ncbi:MAG: N-formylglutamate deformylase [bacterium]